MLVAFFSFVSLFAHALAQNQFFALFFSIEPLEIELHRHPYVLTLLFL
jgi:hypothetical protein